MDEDEPMGALGAYTPEMIQARLDALEREAGAFGQRQQAMWQQQFEDGRRRLEQAQMGPSRAEQLFALSAAFARPQRMRGFAGMMDNLMPTLAGLSGAQREASFQREDALSRLERQYLGQQMEGEQNAFTNRREALKALAQTVKPQLPQIIADGNGGIHAVNRATLEAQTVIAPNDGSHAFGAPVQGGGSANLPRPKTPDEVMRLPPGSRFIAPDGRIGTVPGGPTQSASGGFRNVPSGNPLDPPRR